MNSVGRSLQLDLDRGALRSIVRLLLGLGIAFALAHLVVFVVAPGMGWGPLRELVDLDDDQSVASWFSSLQYLAVTVAALLVARERAHPSALSRGFLRAVAGVALFLSFDEMFGIHEWINKAGLEYDLGPIKALMINKNGAWIAIYAVLALIILVAGRKDLARLWRDYRPEMRPGLLGIVLLGMGEVGLELLTYVFIDRELSGRAYEVEVVLEELSAMAGMSLVLYAVLLVLARSQDPAATSAQLEAPSPDADA